MTAGEGRQRGRLGRGGKEDGRRGVAGGGFFHGRGPPHVMPAHAGSRGKESLFLQFHQVPKNNNLWFK